MPEPIVNQTAGDTDTSVVFAHNSASLQTDNVLGYEIYYSLFDSKSDYTAVVNTINNLTSITPSVLKGRRFFQLSAFADSLVTSWPINSTDQKKADDNSFNLPLIKLQTADRGSAISFKINFLPIINPSGNVNSSFAETDYPQNLYIARKMNDDTIKGFADYSTADSDFSSGFNLDSTDYIYVSFYVFTYGIDPNNYNQEHSNGIYLGTLTFEK